MNTAQKLVAMEDNVSANYWELVYCAHEGSKAGDVWRFPDNSAIVHSTFGPVEYLG